MTPQARRSEDGGPTTGWPQISVIVPVFNGARTIESAVEAILAQAYPAARFEVIVVDNGSADGTPAALARYGSRIRVLTERTRGASAARNAGVRGARHPYVAFTDADCVPDSTWLRELVGFAARNPWADFVGGPIVAYQPRSCVAHFAEMVMDQKRAMCECRPPYAITANLLMRTESVQRLGMFDESLLRGQDVDLSFRGYFRHGFRFGYAERGVVRHVNPSTVAQLFLKGRQHGEAAAAILGKYATELGQTPWRRCTDRRIYTEIAHDLGRSARWACLQAWQPIRDREARDRRQGAQVHLLAEGRIGIPGKGANPGRVVADALDSVTREKEGNEPPEVKPLVGGALQAPVVQIEAVNVNVGDRHKKLRPPGFPDSLAP